MYQETYFTYAGCFQWFRNTRNDHVPVTVAKTRGILGLLPQENVEIKHSLLKLPGKCQPRRRRIKFEVPPWNRLKIVSPKKRGLRPEKSLESWFATVIGHRKYGNFYILSSTVKEKNPDFFMTFAILDGSYRCLVVACLGGGGAQAPTSEASRGKIT